MFVFVWYALLYVYSCFGIILTRKSGLFALLLFSFVCLVTVNVRWLFLTVPWVGLRCVIGGFLDHLLNPTIFILYCLRTIRLKSTK